ncbi:FlgD immunoglobulin-like domain containing protein [Candidatus Latescibacterota bacterium]
MKKLNIFLIIISVSLFVMPGFLFAQGTIEYNVETIYTAPMGMFQIHSGDIDGDGLPEASILRNSGGSFFVDYKDEAYTVSEVYHGGASVFGDVADTDNDGLVEILAGASTIEIVSYIPTTDNFQVDTSIGIEGYPRGLIAGNVGNDGSMRIIAGSNNSGYVHVFKYDNGIYVEEWSGCVVPNAEIIPTVVGDVDNDGQLEFLVNVWERPGYGPSNGIIYMYKWTGETYELVLEQQTDGTGYMPAAVADLDRDGLNELIIDTGKISVYKHSTQNNNFEHIWSASDGDLLQMSIGDVDGDSQDEAVCFFPWSTPGKILVIGYDGTEYVEEAEITDFPDGLGGGTVADFDGDGRNEIITSLFNVSATEYPIFLVKSALLITPVEAINYLIATVEDMNLQHGLTSKLENVIAKLEKGNVQEAIDQLGAFINQVEAKRGKKKGLTNEQADELIGAAQDIIVMISGQEGAAKRVVSQDKVELPESFSLSQNSPNPFNPITTITYTVPADNSGNVSMNIYDIRGALIRTLVNEAGSPGVHSVVWDGVNDHGNAVSSGIYIYRLQAGEYIKSNRMTLVR